MVDLKLVNKGTEGELFIIGSLDSACADSAEEVINGVADRFDTLILNLEALDYTSSAGLRIIRNLQVKMDKKSGRLIIKNPKDSVMEVFEMTGFASFLEIKRDKK